MSATGLLRPWTALLVAAALLFGVVPALGAAAQDGGTPSVVISQVYGGGGNSGAFYRNDFIEVFNRGDGPQSLDGWSVQYASAAGSTWAVTPLSGTLEPGQYYLVQQAAGANQDAEPLPAPDATGTTNMSATNGKVALVNTTTPLSGSCTLGGGVHDFVGFGSTANCFEGSGPTPTLSNPTSAVRLADGCQDTDDNAADFTTATPPTPRNTSSPFTICGDVEPEFTLALFDFEAPDTADKPFPTVVGDDVEVGPMTIGRAGAAQTFPLGSTPDGTGGSAMSSNQWHEGDNYFQFEVTPVDGAEVSPSRLRFDEAASGTGPQTWTAYLVVDAELIPIGTGGTGTTSPLVFGRHDVVLPEPVRGPYDEPFAVRLVGTDASGSGGTWRIDNVLLTAGDVAAPDLSLRCTAPNPITEGYAAADTDFVDSKAIEAVASAGTGDLEFDVTAVEPDPAPGSVTVTAVDGVEAEVRFSDDVPGLDPRDTTSTYAVTIAVTDAEDRTADCTVQVRVVPILNIGAMRGVVPDDANGRLHVSPYALGSPIFQPGPPIAVRGVVTQRTLEENAASPFDFEGFFIQSLDADPADIEGFDPDDPVFADGDPRTSDGVWVTTGTFSTARTDQDPFGQYFAEPGDIVTLRGPIVEDFQQTVLQNPFVVDVVTPGDSGVDLAEHIVVPEVDPPDDVQQASVYWERLAGMQVEVPDDALVVSGNDFFAPSTSEFWAIRGDHPVALREDPDHRRVFRDYHPLAHPAPVDLTEGPGDQNGYRILLGSFGVKATEGDATATITPARSGDRLVDAAQGGLFFSFSKYQVMVADQPELERGPDPSASSLAAVEGFDPADEYSVMVYNVENLYDFRSDPFSGCDLDPDVVPPNQQPTTTCTADEPGGSTVSPPFTYAPRSQESYDAHRIAIAEQILDALAAPDIITIQEAEKQDVCVPMYDETDPAASFMECDLSAPEPDEDPAGADRGSGAPDTVEELALEIFRLSDGAVRYEASGDALNGRDVRGITQAFLHRTDRVELVPEDELHDDPVLGAGDAVDIPYPEAGERTTVAPWVLETANPKAVNAELPDDVPIQDGGRFPQTGYVFTRGVQVGLFRVYPDGVGTDTFVDRYVTSNHMSAGPDARVEQRTEQARLNAAVAEVVRDADGQVLVTGDFNVFPRPDDPFPAYKTDPNRPPTDQLAAMYERGFINLHDVIIEEAPANTYSFIFRGISQILDHIFVDDGTLEELVVARYIHVNVDYPAETPGFEPGRGASDHDPLYARFLFEVPEPPGPPCDRLPPQSRARPCRADDPPPGWSRAPGLNR